MIVQAVMIWATGVGVGVRVQTAPESLGDGRISGRFFIRRKMKGKAVDVQLCRHFDVELITYNNKMMPYVPFKISQNSAVNGLVVRG
jgi:hypothetical protein